MYMLAPLPATVVDPMLPSALSESAGLVLEKPQNAPVFCPLPSRNRWCVLLPASLAGAIGWYRYQPGTPTWSAATVLESSAQPFTYGVGWRELLLVGSVGSESKFSE